MEYLASKAYHFSVWSSDPQLIHGTNITIRAHGKCSVLRLLQYVHHLSVQQGNGSFSMGVDEIQLCYKFGALSKETQCQQIEPNYPGVIRLRLEKKKNIDRSQENGAPIEYDPESFSRTSILVQCNTLSVEKIFKVKLDDVYMYSTVSHLAKMALESLNQYEQTRNLNICAIKKHTLEDVVALDIAGRSHAIHLSESTEDLTLSDLLGIDFAPAADAYCTLLCKVKHSQADDGVTIEFVSEAKFTMQKMVVNSDTTILDVKNFICSVYAHALRLQPHDIKLIYKGCILHELNGASNEPNRILKFITEPTGAKLHVHITHEYSEPGPGFWNELLFAPDRFEFMPRRGDSNGNNNNGNTSTSTSNTNTFTSAGNARQSVPNIAVTSGPNLAANSAFGSTLSNRSENDLNHNSNQLQQTTNSRSPTPTATPTRTSAVLTEPEVPILMTDGLPVTRSYETYERITVDDQDYIIPQSQLAAQYFELQIGDKTLRLSKDEITLGEKCMKLSGTARAAIENALGEKIQRNEVQYNVDEELLPDLPNPNAETGATNQPAGGILARMNIGWESPRVIFQWIISTVTGRSGFFLFLAFELFPILPLWLFNSIAGIVAARLIWSKLQLGKRVRRIVIGSYDEMPTEEIEQIRTLLKNEKFPIEFFERLARTSKVSTVLCTQLEQNQDLLELLLQEIKRNPVLEEQLSQNEQLATQHKYILKQFVLLTTTGVGNESRDKLKYLYYELFRDTFEKVDKLLTQELHSLPPWAAPIVKDMRKSNLKTNRKIMTNRLYFNLLLDVYRPWNFFTDNTLMRYVVPNPRTDNIILGILKNCLLFVLLFVPNCERQFEEIIEERLIEQSQEEEHVQLA